MCVCGGREITVNVRLEQVKIVVTREASSWEYASNCYTDCTSLPVGGV